MKAQLTVSEEFKNLLQSEMSKRDVTIGGLAYKCGISYEWMRKMATMGHIPSRETLAKLAKGLELDEQHLLVLAGYEKPSGLVSAVEQALPPVSDMTEEEKTGFLEVVKGYSSARHASTRHYIAEAVRKILEEEAAEQPDS